MSSAGEEEEEKRNVPARGLHIYSRARIIANSER